MRKTAGRIVLAGMMLISLAGCSTSAITGSDENKGPVGIGNSINEHKRSPCACMEIPMQIPADLRVG